MTAAQHSTYPNAWAQGVTIRNLPVLNTYYGQVLWVDSGNGSDTNKGTHRRPFATVEFADSKADANNGDLVMVAPGHSETYSAAAGWTLETAGVQYIGLGTGADRPKIIMDTAVGVDINITADNCAIHNFQFEAAFADIEKLLHVTAKNFVVDSCEFREQVATENWVLVIDCDGTTNNECDGLTFTNNVVIGADTANQNIIKGAADITGLNFSHNYIELGVLDNDAIIEMLTGQDLRSCRVLHNDILRLNTAGELLINTDTGTANTGICAYNTFGCLDTTTVVLIETTTNIMQFENYVTGVADESGYLIPVAGEDST